MDEIITDNKLTWDACSNDVFGFCANHPFHEYQLDNYLSIRKLQNAKDNQNIHPATESLVVALTDLCSRDNSNRLKIVIAIPICSHNLENIFERVLKCIVKTVPRINQYVYVM